MREREGGRERERLRSKKGVKEYIKERVEERARIEYTRIYCRSCRIPVALITVAALISMHEANRTDN